MRPLTGLTALFTAASVLAVVACGGGAGESPERADTAETIAAPTEPRSVILLVGDGMGPQQVGLLLDWATAAGESPTAFERLTAAGSLGLVRTGAQGTPLTDSASSATAFSSGVEVPNGAIAMDAEGRPTRTCLEDARDTGRATGLVTSTRLTHATPAAFAAHVPRRDMENGIGDQLLAAGVDVLLGGGARYVKADVAAASGYRVVTTPEELAGVPPGTAPLLGLFADSHLPYAIDRDAPSEPRAPSLATMTRVALDALSRDPDGFFLMVEGGRIDHGGHINDVAAVLGEMREFDAAIAVAEEFRATHPETLVIVTADHETGGLAISAGGMPLLDRHFLEMTQVESTVEAQAPPRDERERTDPAVFGVGRRNFYPPYSHWETSRALRRNLQWNVSYGTQGHTTTPVPIVAAGPGSERFGGLLHNEAVGRLLREWMSIPAAERGDAEETR